MGQKQYTICHAGAWLASWLWQHSANIPGLVISSSCSPKLCFSVPAFRFVISLVCVHLIRLHSYTLAARSSLFWKESIYPLLCDSSCFAFSMDWHVLFTSLSIFIPCNWSGLGFLWGLRSASCPAGSTHTWDICCLQPTDGSRTFPL